MSESPNNFSSEPDAVYWGSCLCPALKADPDIAGIGVISSFITSSCLAIISTCLYLTIFRSGLVPDRSYDPSSKRSCSFDPSDHFNPIDRFMRKHCCTPFVRFILRSQWIESRIDKIQVALFSCVMSLADMQLVMGVAILSAAILKLHRGSISIYHFSIVMDLAWLSSHVHLLALLAIRTELIGSMKKKCRWKSHTPRIRSRSGRARDSLGRGGDIIVRVIGMLVLAALLLYCSYVAGADGWDEHYHCPASCAKGKKKGGSPFKWMVANFVLVLRAYPERCLALWPAARVWWIDNARHRIVDNQGLGKPEKPANMPRKVYTQLWYIFSSETIDVVVEGFGWFVLGVFWIVSARNGVHDWWKNSTDIGKENEIDGFGQLVPILLLGTPFLQVLETYCAESRAVQRKKQKEERRGEEERRREEETKGDEKRRGMI